MSSDPNKNQPGEMSHEEAEALLLEVISIVHFCTDDRFTPTEISHEEAEAELFAVTSMICPCVGDEFNLGMCYKESKKDLEGIVGGIARHSGFPVEEVWVRMLKALHVPKSLTRLSPTITRLLVRYFDQFWLERVGQLDDECAEILSGIRGGELRLNGLSDISTYQIKCLASSGADLSLRGLKSISLPDAVALGQASGRLDLSGLESLSPEAAAEIMRNRSELWLTGLKSLNPELIAALRENANWEHPLRLGWWCSWARGPRLSLGTGPKLGLENAREIALWPHMLDLVGFKEMTLQEANALADSKAFALRLYDLNQLPPDQAMALGRFKGEELTLWNLSEISDESFMGLMRASTGLRLKALAALSDEQARLLQFYPHEVVLDGLLEIPESQARHLVARSKTAYISVNTRIPETFRKYLHFNANSPLQIWLGGIGRESADYPISEKILTYFGTPPGMKTSLAKRV